LSGSLNIPHISTGQLLRAEVSACTLLGLRAKATMQTGGLVSDDLVNELVVQRINKPDCRAGFIMDGYPRNVGQAVTLDRVLRPEDRQIVIDVFADLEKITSRLTGRRTCSCCGAVYHLTTSPPRRGGLCDRCGGELVQRADDREDVIRARFRAYHELTTPLIDHYRDLGIYHRVDGMRSVDQVACDVQELLAGAPVNSFRLSNVSWLLCDV
jgi:adenylate kinase